MQSDFLDRSARIQQTVNPSNVTVVFVPRFWDLTNSYGVPVPHQDRPDLVLDLFGSLLRIHQDATTDSKSHAQRCRPIARSLRAPVSPRAATQRQKKAAREFSRAASFGKTADFLVHNSVSPFPRLAFRRLDFQAELLGHMSADEPANAVVLPVGRLRDLCQCRAFLALHEFQDLLGLAAGSGAFRLGCLRDLLGLSGLRRL